MSTQSTPNAAANAISQAANGRPANNPPKKKSNFLLYVIAGVIGFFLIMICVYLFADDGQVQPSAAANQEVLASNQAVQNASSIPNQNNDYAKKNAIADAQKKVPPHLASHIVWGEEESAVFIMDDGNRKLNINSPEANIYIAKEINRAIELKARYGIYIRPDGSMVFPDPQTGQLTPVMLEPSGGYAVNGAPIEDKLNGQPVPGLVDPSGVNNEAGLMNAGVDTPTAMTADQIAAAQQMAMQKQMAELQTQNTILNEKFTSLSRDILVEREDHNLSMAKMDRENKLLKADLKAAAADLLMADQPVIAKSSIKVAPSAGDSKVKAVVGDMVWIEQSNGVVTIAKTGEQLPNSDYKILQARPQSGIVVVTPK